MNITVGKKAIADASEKLKNWGRWGKDDQIGTLNHIKPEDIVKAAALIRTGKVFALGIPLDRNGPQTGLFGGRWNPIHTMLATGTDAVAGRQDVVRTSATPTTPSTCRCNARRTGTRSATSSTRSRCTTATTPASSTATGSASSASSIPGTRWSAAACCSTSPGSRASTWLDDGYGISNAELDACAKAQDVKIGAATSSSCAPGRWRVPQGRLGRLCRRRRAGREVRELLLVPGQGDRRDLLRHLGRRGASQRDQRANQPWHWVVIPPWVPPWARCST